MIPNAMALAPLLPERQAALQAIIAVERAQQTGSRLARYPFTAAFMKQLSGSSRISVKGLNRIHGIYYRPCGKRAPLPEWESALDILLSTAGEVCPLPLPCELAGILFPEAVFRHTERAGHMLSKTLTRSARRTRQAAEHEQQRIECTIRQAEIELAFRTPDTLRGWFSAWCDDVPEYDMKNMIAAWARRFPALTDLETLQLWSEDAACEVAGEIHLRALHMSCAQAALNSWLVPNKLTG